MRHAFFAALLCALAVVTVAQASPPPPRPACKPAATCETRMLFEVDPAFEKHGFRDDIQRALQDWYVATEGRLCFVERPWDPATRSADTLLIHEAHLQVDLYFAIGDRDFANHLGVYRTGTHELWVVTEFAAEAEGEVEGITAHELGHAIGFNHTIDLRVPSVMHPRIDQYSLHKPFVYSYDYDNYCAHYKCLCAQAKA